MQQAHAQEASSSIFSGKQPTNTKHYLGGKDDRYGGAARLASETPSGAPTSPNLNADVVVLEKALKPPSRGQGARVPRINIADGILFERRSKGTKL